MCFSYGNVCLQFSSVAPHVGLCHAVDCSTQGLPVHHHLPFTQTHDHSVCDAIQPSNPVVPFSSCLQPFPASGSFQMSQFFHQVAKLLEFQLQHQLKRAEYSNEYSGRISFRIDWLGLLEVQGTLKSLLQHHSSKASTLWCSAFSMVQTSHSYMTAGKTIALIRRTFVGKVMSLLCDMLSRLVITFLPRSKHLLISWLQSPSAVDFGAPQNKVSHFSHCFPIYLPQSDGARCHDLHFLNVEL